MIWALNLPLFYVLIQANDVLTDQSPPRFMCIVLHQLAKLNDNNPSNSGAELSQVLRYTLFESDGCRIIHLFS